jgi:hypothetical protein
MTEKIKVIQNDQANDNRFLQTLLERFGDQAFKTIWDSLNHVPQLQRSLLVTDQTTMQPSSFLISTMVNITDPAYFIDWLQQLPFTEKEREALFTGSKGSSGPYPLTFLLMTRPTLLPHVLSYFNEQQIKRWLKQSTLDALVKIDEAPNAWHIITERSRLPFFYKDERGPHHTLTIHDVGSSTMNYLDVDFQPTYMWMQKYFGPKSKEKSDLLLKVLPRWIQRGQLKQLNKLLTHTAAKNLTAVEQIRLLDAIIIGCHQQPLVRMNAILGRLSQANLLPTSQLVDTYLTKHLGKIGYRFVRKGFNAPSITPAPQYVISTSNTPVSEQLRPSALHVWRPQLNYPITQINPSEHAPILPHHAEDITDEIPLLSESNQVFTHKNGINHALDEEKTEAKAIVSAHDKTQRTFNALLAGDDPNACVHHCAMHKNDIDFYAVNTDGQNMLIQRLEYAIAQKLILPINPQPEQYHTLNELSPMAAWLLDNTLLTLTADQWLTTKQRLKTLYCHADLIRDIERLLETNAKKQADVKTQQNKSTQQSEYTINLAYRKKYLSSLHQWLDKPKHKDALRILQLRHSDLSGEQLRKLVKKLKKTQRQLKHIDISEQALNESTIVDKEKQTVFQRLLPYLSAFTQLEFIDVHQSELTDSDMDALLTFLDQRIYPITQINLSGNPNISQAKRKAVEAALTKIQQRAHWLGINTTSTYKPPSTEVIQQQYSTLTTQAPIAQSNERYEPQAFEEVIVDADGDCGFHCLGDQSHAVTREMVKSTFIQALQSPTKRSCLLKLFKEEMADYASRGYQAWMAKEEDLFSQLQSRYPDIDFQSFRTRLIAVEVALKAKKQSLRNTLSGLLSDVGSKKYAQVTQDLQAIQQFRQTQNQWLRELEKQHPMQWTFFKILEENASLEHQKIKWLNQLQTFDSESGQYRYRNYPTTFSTNLPEFLKQLMQTLQSKTDDDSTQWKEQIRADLDALKKFNQKISRTELKRNTFLSNRKNLSTYLACAFSANSTTYLGEMSLQAYSALQGEKTKIYLKDTKANKIKQGMNHVNDQDWETLSGCKKPKKYRYVLHTKTAMSATLNHYNLLVPVSNATTHQQSPNADAKNIRWLTNSETPKCLLESSLQSYRWLYEQLEIAINALSQLHPTMKDAENASEYQRLVMEATTLKADFEKDKQQKRSNRGENYIALLRPNDPNLSQHNATQQLKNLQKRCAGLSLLTYLTFAEHESKPPIYQLTNVLNQLTAQHASQMLQPMHVINESDERNQMDAAQQHFTHCFSIQLGNMYTTSQVHEAELYELDNYLTQREKLVKFGEELLFGVAGFFGGAGHLLHTAGSFMKVFHSPGVKRIIESGIMIGGAGEMVENGLSVVKHVAHKVGIHSNHHENNAPGGYVKTKTQLRNLNKNFSHTTEFNVKHDIFNAHLAFCYQDQLNLLEESQIGIFADVCADHWLEALMKGYIHTHLKTDELIERGMIWMSYVKIASGTDKKVRLKSGQYVMVDDLLKKPPLRTLYQVTEPDDYNAIAPAGELTYALTVQPHDHTLCDALKDRLVKEPNHDSRLGYRRPTQKEVALTKNPEQRKTLIKWPNVMTLNVLRKAKTNQSEEALFQHATYTPCPYDTQWATNHYLARLQNRILSLEKEKERMLNDYTYLDKKIETKYNDVIDQLAKEKEELLQKIDKIKLELKTQKDELKKQSDEIKKLKQEIIQEKNENIKLKGKFAEYKEDINVRLVALEEKLGMDEENASNLDITNENKESIPSERSPLEFNSIYSESLNSQYHYNKGKQALEESECVNISIGVDR